MRQAFEYRELAPAYTVLLSEDADVPVGMVDDLRPPARLAASIARLAPGTRYCVLGWVAVPYEALGEKEKRGKDVFTRLELVGEKPERVI